LTYVLLSLSRSIALTKKRLPCRWLTRWASVCITRTRNGCFFLRTETHMFTRFAPRLRTRMFLHVLMNVLPCVFAQCSWFVPPKSACRRRMCFVDGPGTGRNRLQWYSARIVYLVAAREHLSLRLSVAHSAIDHPPLGHLLSSLTQRQFPSTNKLPLF